MRPLFTTLLAASVLACSATAAVPPCDPVAGDGSISVEVVGGDGQRLPSFGRRGDVWILGHRGDRYSIRIRNQSSERVETVVSVDGRDAIDGKASTWTKRGYLVPAWGEVLIDGFRLSSQEVAAFRFAPIEDSYAAKTGSTRDVGVIGVAVFRERRPRPHVYVPHRGGYDGRGGDDEKSAPSAEGAPAPRTSDAMRPSEPSYKEDKGLGTAFGERRSSPVTEVAFERSSYQPDRMFSVRYDSPTGLMAQGIDLGCRNYGDNDAWRRRTAQPFAESPGRYASPPAGWPE